MKKFIFAILSSFMLLSVSSQTLLDTAINFSVKDTYGNTINLYYILDEGQMVVIDFFSTS